MSLVADNLAPQVALPVSRLAGILLLHFARCRPGTLQGKVVVLVHTDRDGEMHVISLRRAEPHEARYYFEVTESHLGKED